MPRYKENIYKRKDGRWEGRYIKGYHDGKAKYGSVYARTYTEVHKKLINAIITAPLIESLLLEKLKNGRLDGTGGLSNKTVQDMVIIIRSVISYAKSKNINLNAGRLGLKLKGKDKNTFKCRSNQAFTVHKNRHGL